MTGLSEAERVHRAGRRQLSGFPSMVSGSVRVKGPHASVDEAV